MALMRVCTMRMAPSRTPRRRRSAARRERVTATWCPAALFTYSGRAWHTTAPEWRLWGRGRHDVVVPGLLVLAIASAFYPTLLAISIVLLGMPNPRPLLLGYLGGALTASIGSGLAIVFVLGATDAVGSSHPTASPAVDVAGGILVLALGLLIATGRLQRFRDRRRAARGPREPRPSWSSRILSRGSVPLAFGVAMVLSVVPGLLYLVALKDIAAGGYGPAVKVILVVAFNLV